MPGPTVIDQKEPVPVQTQVDSTGVLIAVEKHRAQRGGLIAMLGEIQAEHGCLPELALKVLSEQTGRALEDIYGVATFYRSFSLEPRGQHRVCACLGTACHVRGAQRVVEALERKLGITAGQTTTDKAFSLETVNCLGACALGPVIVIDGRYHSKVKKSAVSELLDKAAQGNGAAEAGADHGCFVLNVSCPHCRQGLADERHVLDDCPSIRLNATLASRVGWVQLSSLYGSRLVATEFQIPKSAVVDFQCPHCSARLPSPAACWDCGAPMCSLQVIGGGTVSFCSRRGCPHHVLDVT
jgi:NADH-quinone oxidoreductase subunit E